MKRPRARKCDMDPVRASPCRPAANIETPHQQAGHTKALGPTLGIGQGKMPVSLGASTHDCPGSELRHTIALRFAIAIFGVKHCPRWTHFNCSPAVPELNGVCGPSFPGSGMAFAGGPRCGPLVIPLRRARLAPGRSYRRLSGGRMLEAVVLHLLRADNSASSGGRLIDRKLLLYPRRFFLSLDDRVENC